jgi:CoA-transferase family III
MGSTDQANGVNGTALYSVPDEAQAVLDQSILQNPLIASELPLEAFACRSKIHFVGSAQPSIPINWRFAESAASLKGLEAILIGALLKRKYDVDVGDITIDTDHAQLFFMSSLIWTIDPVGPSPIPFGRDPERVEKYFPNCDKHRMSSFHRRAATNIYKTADGQFFHLHGSMNADPTLDSIGLPHDMDAASIEDSWAPFVAKMATIPAVKMQHLATDVYRQAGTICETLASYRASEHGQANAGVGLFEITHASNPGQPPGWWPASPQTSSARPLAGLKVVDLTRVIASPAVTRGLAELGASVMRVTAPHLPDYSSLHLDLNWGKWNCHLDLKTEHGRQQLRQLILDADVVVNGYRPGVLDKYGFGQDAIIELCASRDRGIVSVRENCYGWHGPWAGRSGWQQISDASVGISAEFGRAMGLADGEAVTPVFPNSDYMTGIAGVCGILTALMRRAQIGGSYRVDVALNYYNQWLANSVGTYPADVWEDVWARNGRQVFRYVCLPFPWSGS